ncbi:MAG: hypothetical protein FWD57_16735, partial [Polyangiaceae bacterium]|nr:hypothetical protein [Polyangiaceae bacterium]
WIPRIGAACSEDGGSICDGLGKCAKWKSVATGVRHTCGVTESGTAMCWGDNSYGQLGNGKGGEYGTKSQVPQAVVGLETGVVAISAGGGHSCAVTSAGSVECWGQHIFMQFFEEETISDLNAVPAQVLGPESGAVAVSSGYGHACALTSAGGAMCWGWNFSGQLGDGTRIDNETPQTVLGLEAGVLAVTGGTYFSCAISSELGTVCWANIDGFGTVLDPVWYQVTGLEPGVAMISSGYRTTCVIGSVGEAMCWGDNSSGQIGDDGKCVIEEFSATSQNGHRQGLPQKSRSYDYSQSVNGTDTVRPLDLYDDCYREQPTQVSGLESGVTGISVGNCGACAVTSGGAVMCWGCNHGDGPGFASIARVPMPVPGLESGVVQVAEGHGFSCAVTTSGEILCWGDGKSGQLGSGFLDSSVPVPVIGY